MTVIEHKQTAIPPGYRQTEVGVIPEDWGVTALRELVGSLEAGVSVNSEDSTTSFDETAAILKTSCVAGGNFFPQESKTIHSSDMSRARLNPRADSIIISRMNTPALVGECGYVNCDYPTLFLPDRLWMTSRQQLNVHCVRWLAYLLSYPVYSKALKAGATGTSGSMKNISKPAFYGVNVPLPPTLAEQEAIAGALSDADAWIASLEKLIAKKRAIKQGTMQALLTPPGQPGHQRLPGFEGKWEVKRLGSSASLKARIGWQGLTTAEYRDQGDYYLVTGTEFSVGAIDWDKCHYVDQSRYDQDKNIQLREHDILVTKDGTIGKVALIRELPKPATLNSGVFVIRPVHDAFAAEFFYYLLCSSAFTEYLAQLSAGSTINHLYQKDFVSFEFSLPRTISEQSAIAAVLTVMDAEIEELEAKLSKARQIKQGMMQDLLTGKVRLI